MVKENDVPQDDPCDVVEVENLAGWTRYDSSRMRPENPRQGLERSREYRHSNAWLRLDYGRGD